MAASMNSANNAASWGRVKAPIPTQNPESAARNRMRPDAVASRAESKNAQQRAIHINKVVCDMKEAANNNSRGETDSNSVATCATAAPKYREAMRWLASRKMKKARGMATLLQGPASQRAWPGKYLACHKPEGLMMTLCWKNAGGQGGAGALRWPAANTWAWKQWLVASVMWGIWPNKAPWIPHAPPNPSSAIQRAGENRPPRNRSGQRRGASLVNNWAAIPPASSARPSTHCDVRSKWT